MASTDPITCHVLDQSIGQPAREMKVCLTWEQGSKQHKFEAETNRKGRIGLWHPSATGASEDQPTQTVGELMDAIEGQTTWTLHFDTGGYFKDAATFFPKATVSFRVEKGNTYHVPLLLSPFGYTVYRGC